MKNLTRTELIERLITIHLASQAMFEVLEHVIHDVGREDYCWLDKAALQTHGFVGFVEGLKGTRITDPWYYSRPSATGFRFPDLFGTDLGRRISLLAQQFDAKNQAHPSQEPKQPA